MAAAALATAGATGGNMISSLGTAVIQSQTAEATNKANLGFQNSMVNRGEKSFTDIGLPKAMYYGGNSLTSPNQMFHLGGSNFYEGSGVNTNLPVFTTNPYSQFSHQGQPKYLSKGSASNIGRSTETGGVSSTSEGSSMPYSSTGQTDRVGLGAGRYSAVPPPKTLYNSAGTQAAIDSNTRFTQTVPDKKVYVRDAYSYTQPGLMMSQTNPYRMSPGPSFGFSTSSAQYLKINPKFL